jgi:hypothetical protein
MDRRSSANILVREFCGLSSPQFVPAETITELESSVNPQAEKPALRHFGATPVCGLPASAMVARRVQK